MDSEKRKEQVRKYHQKLDRVIIRLRKDGSSGLTRDQITECAAKNGLSANQFMIDAILEKIRASK